MTTVNPILKSLFGNAPLYVQCDVEHKIDNIASGFEQFFLNEDFDLEYFNLVWGMLQFDANILKDVPDSALLDSTSFENATPNQIIDVFATLITKDIKLAADHYGIPFEDILEYIYEDPDYLFGELYYAMLRLEFSHTLDRIIEDNLLG